MQPPTVPPRDTLSAEQVVALLQDAPGVTAGYGCELTDLSLVTIEDISADLAGGSVSRNSYANLHLTGQFAISRELDWGAALIRPYYTLSDGVITARFNLGAHYTSTPGRDLVETPITYDVQTYDVLSILDDPVGDAYAVAAGTTYLTAVEDILLDRGVQSYLIDQTSAAAVLPTDRVWKFDANTTWLLIVNELLASIAYAGIWSDWDGRLRVQPYLSPLQRGAEWTYSTDVATTMLSNRRSYERDFFATPNRWVFFRQNNIDDVAPVEGNGMLTYTNHNRGDTSTQARGRTITKVVGLDVADHASLIAAAQRTIDGDMQVPQKISVRTFPHPMHWHFDRLFIDDTKAGPPLDAMCTAWTLPLGGDDMTHEWVVI
jgi:hypothetical protein